MSAVSCWALWMLGAALAAAPPESRTPRERYLLKNAMFESHPLQPTAARYRLDYEWLPAPPPRTKSSGALELTSRLSKAGPAQCPAPGTLFFDGFESP
jgi:hypothetical protein